jgi:hypothetical protein
MTIPRFLSLSKYWQDHPPVHHLVAAFTGYKGRGGGKATPKPSQDADREMENFFAEFSGLGGQVILN